MKTVTRCTWCSDDPLYQQYHDHEWGVQCYDDPTLLEFLILEGAQAGLAWITILRKREGYRRAFAQFDAQKIARFSDKKLEQLLLDPAIVRNRLKVFSARTNARAFIKVQEEFGSFSDYLWGFVEHQPIQNHWQPSQTIPACTERSNALSKDLQGRGFKFVGSTIIYAYMQAIGMVNDHTTNCFRYKPLSSE
jgi:DNA-3-methyladenine glycosylase I